MRVQLLLLASFIGAAFAAPVPNANNDVEIRVPYPPGWKREAEAGAPGWKREAVPAPYPPGWKREAVPAPYPPGWKREAVPAPYPPGWKRDAEPAPYPPGWKRELGDIEA